MGVHDSIRLTLPAELMIQIMGSIKMRGEEPRGYIHAGPLFGWDYPPTRKYNNPFWYPDGPCFLEQKDPARRFFATHTFVEFTWAADRVLTVLDITHGILDPNDEVVLAHGQHDMETYHRETIDEGKVVMRLPRKVVYCNAPSGIAQD